MCMLISWHCCYCIAVILSICFSDSAAQDTTTCQHIFHIDSNYTGNVSANGCGGDLERLSSCTCKTLEGALQQLPQSISCPYEDQQFTYNLPAGDQKVNGTTAYFTWSGTVVFTGQDNSSRIICTGDDVGWNFNNLVEVNIQSITFVGCSSLRPSTTRNVSSGNSTYEFKVALYFNLCGTIEMNNVTVLIDAASGVTGVVMYNPSTINIMDCSFIGSVDPEHASYFSRKGGGFVLELTACAPGIVTKNCEVVNMKQTTSKSYHFTDCTFENNSALSSNEIPPSPMDPVTGLEYNSFGKGGGLSIIIKNIANSSVFVIRRCNFIGNFAQLHGGGLFVSLLDRANGNSIEIRNSKFRGNHCPFSGLTASSGGAVHLENLLHDQSSQGNHLPLWSGNAFDGNSAYAGGGLSLTFKLVEGGGCNDCGIYSTNFTNNLATFGSAIHIQRLRTSQLESQPSSALVMNGCKFDANFIYRASENNKFAQNGLGTVYSNQNDISFESDVLFENNTGSALVMVSAVANFSLSNATFIRNSLATRGGAMLLLGSSYMVIGQDTVMKFDSNSATYRGGGIYKQYLEPVIQHADCFVKYNSPLPLSPDSWDAKLRFDGNVVSGNIPNAIHSTSVQPCISKVHRSPLCWKGWEYNSILCGSDRTASEEHITTNTNEELSYTTRANISAIPGWPVAITELSIHNDLNNTIMNIEVYLATVNSTPVSLSTMDNFVMTGKPNESVLVHFESLGDRSVYVDVPVDLWACPPGFVAKETDKGIPGARKCECMQEHETIYNSLLKCQSELGTGTAVLMGNHWMGRVKEGDDYVIAPCPLHLCKASNFLILPNTSRDLSSKICKYGRMGVLCGECMTGHCLSVNSWSYDCIPFKNDSRNMLAASLSKYVSAVYLPYAAFLLIITAFHLKLTRGSLNGLVLFAQMITTTFDLTQHDSLPLKRTSRFFPKTYRFLYGGFNLNFIEKHICKFCFSSELNTLSVLLLNYLLFVVPILVVFLAAVITKISRRCTIKHSFETKSIDKGWMSNYSRYFVGFSKPLRENVILLLSTVVLLSYTKLCTTSAQILHVKTLVSMNGTIYENARVFIAGQMSTDGGYVNYQIPAVLCGVYLSTLALLLLDYPLRLIEFLARKIRLLRAVFPSAFIRDFTHEFQSCYRPNFKFFAAVYFMFRFVASLVFISGYSLINRYVILEVSCLVVILLLVTCKPYKENTHNLIDIFIFANLAIINALNYFQNGYFQLTNKKQASGLVFSFQYVLSMIPITCFSFCACMKLAVRHEPIRRQLQRLLLKVPNNQVQMLNNTLTSDAPPKSIEQGSESEQDTSHTRPLIGKVRNEVRAKENRMAEPGPDVPVTIIGVCDKGMGEATTCQTSLSEGYYLRTEWSSERNNYGTTTR